MKVLFVCLGNICRSPIGEGIFKSVVNNEDAFVDSAGTSAYHVGESPDRRSIEVAKKHGIDISLQKSRKLTTDDFHSFDYIFAMDKSNLKNIKSIQPIDSNCHVYLLREFDTIGKGEDVPDPYYGGDSGFEDCFSMIKRSCENFLNTINYEK